MPRFAYIAACLLLSGLVVTTVWLPFGFEMGGLIEEWGFLGLLIQHGHFFVVGRDGIVPSLAMRPLTFLMPALANKLAAHSFVPWHVLLIISLVLKGAAGGWWVARLSKSAFLGAMAVVLFIVYPADTMQISLRSLHINWAITLVMLGSCALIWALEACRGTSAIVMAVLAATLSVGGIAMYEASLALFLMVPGYFFVKEGARKAIVIARRQARVSLLFGAGIVLYGVYLANIGGAGGSYQGSLVGGGANIPGILSVTFPKLFTVGALHVFWGGWVEAYRLLLVQPINNLTYLVGSSCVLLIATLQVAMRLPLKDGAQGGASGLSSASAMRLMLVGLVMALAGYFPYLLSLSHLSISQRTFLAATPGAVLAWIGVMALIVDRSRLITVWCLAVALILGLVFQLYQFSHYQYLSDLQRKLLGDVVSQYGQREGTPPIVIRDHSNLLGHTWMFLPENLGWALSYVVGHPVGPLEICRQPAGEWMRRDALGRTGHCYEMDGQWIFEEADPVSGPGLPPSDKARKEPIKWPVVTTVTVDAGRSLALNGSGLPTVVNENVPGSKKYVVNPTGLYGVNWPLMGWLWESSYGVSSCYRWDFGDVWSLELPIRGNGWREAEWTVSGQNKVSAAWMTGSTGSLYFELLPRDDEYMLRFTLAAAVNDQILKGLSLSINGTELAVVMTGLVGVANVPKGVLKSGLNELEFKSAVVKDFYGLSIMLDRVSLEARSFPTECR